MIYARVATDMIFFLLGIIKVEPERTFATDEIATEFAISRHHLTKVVRDLAAANTL